MPQERGVGRIAKAPIPVPLGLAQAALRVVEEENEDWNPFWITYWIGPAEEYQRLKEWSLELSRRLDKTVKDGRQTFNVPYSFYLYVEGTLRTINADMARDQYLFRRRSIYNTRSHESDWRYEVLVLYRGLALASVQFELQLCYPDSCVEVDGAKNDRSVDPLSNDSHLFDTAILAADAILWRVERRGPLRRLNSEKEAQYSVEDFQLMPDLEKALRDITATRKALTIRSIREHQTEMTLQ